MHGAADPAALARALGLLRGADLRAALGGIAAPALVLGGQYDRVTPPGAARALAAALPDARHVEFARCGHAPFISHATSFATAVRDFPRHGRPGARTASSTSAAWRARSTAPAPATTPRQRCSARCAPELLARLPPFGYRRAALLDLGAGTGHATAALARAYPDALVIALDIAPGMLAAAGQRLGWRDRWLGGRFGHPFARIGGDALRLPLAAHSIDLAFSNLMLQWCDELDAALAEIHRCLRPGALFTFSTFGPGTLRELREAWATADAREHVNPFVDMHDLGEALVRAGFSEPVLDVDRHVLGYADAPTLMRELKAIGAHNALQGRPRGLTGRARYAAVLRAYEAQRRADGRLPATWEVIHCTTFAAQPAPRAHGAPSAFPMRAGEASVPLDALKLRGRRTADPPPRR
ncbi:MAG: malonyl-ACP O-methyltransferase BioC [Steroidobacteraceae bacterium]